jgi:hypothetical protein
MRACVGWFVLSAFAATPAVAAPVTWLFTGTATGVATGGIFAGLVSIGDTYTLKYSFDDTQTPDVNFSIQSRWLSGNRSEVSINGMTFALGDTSALSTCGGGDRNAVISAPNPFLDPVGSDHIYDGRCDATVSVGGNATSTHAGATYMTITWGLTDRPDHTQLDDFPMWPSAIVLDDWTRRDFSIEVRGATQFDYLSFLQPNTAFSTWQVVREDGVPAPGALALLGLGLLGFGGVRRRATRR